MAEYTSNYQLHQWVPEDDFLRTDFNTDFQKIDAALAAKAAQSALESVQELAEGKCRMIVGYYAGNNYNPRTINVGVTPTVLLVSLDSSSVNTITATRQGGTVAQVTVVENGFRLDSGSVPVNTTGLSYSYIVLV